ncbi:maleylpyruvate isomerase family mycothiol-dependent enzyme [Saccharopolyspora sp. WRP15-2]|uniref:Maleylpyruvate isomerase family mycothiol-dependent enzyme n=1 Tax=Saccharopolyspora oryzae TaxID=2997343 RepID=A0ABT4V5D7_9PSEU|nr:maleylpyruvate isomerase N-terminal domain-containing protein [Saccharopolyspora oryzae]MDA3629180.1 maleylpyruvate isomerase family mycothiol-dependent enzyme [Saccharopolyspora oryzae]
MADIALGTAAQVTSEVAAQLSAVDRATQRLLRTVGDLDEVSVRQPSLLPRWSRAHVIAHLARNADGLVNLMIWARTGIEHAMYASRDDRDQAIAEGSQHSHQLLFEDLAASCDRFASAVQEMPDHAWTAEIAYPVGDPIPAHHVLRLRLMEVWVHLVDLDHDVDFADIPRPDVEQLLEDAVQQFGGRPDVPALAVEVDFGDHQRTWDLRGTTAPPSRVRGEPGPMLGWLLGRTDAQDLQGTAPDLPDWR